MTTKFFQIEEAFTRKIWKKLRDNQVPVVTQEIYSDLIATVDRTNKDLRSKAYMPSIGHGFLGLKKGGGVTRFLPILSNVDMAIYYHICFTLSDQILVRRERVFGGWHLVPRSQKVTDQNQQDSTEIGEEEAQSFLQDYFSDPFSSALWLKEWRQFTVLIRELCNTQGIGNYVVETDIANFYDSIEIPRLVRNLRRDAHNNEELIEALELFLGFWNRRLNGYQASTKGIPQEIISDASRVVAHYYLQRFDEEFSKYCTSNGLINVRWSDDILIFGKSRKSLELAIHKASKILLSDGLNLNASKTQIFSRRDFERYRATDVLAAIGNDDAKAFRRSLRSAIQWNKKNKMRIDTVFRATIGYVKKLGSNAQIFEKNFVLEIARSDVNLLLSLNARQLLNLISISDDKKSFFKLVISRITSVPYAAPRATFLHMLRKYHKELVRIGVSRRNQLNAAETIKKNSQDSEIILQLCIPPTLRILEK
ncbi:MAG: hypothetical protein C0605_15680 [Hyphomicrobiales bacterium]|nr:MAG: hypothetical protein C0605_15680 [Hyphomicrobiales bacterium]